MDVRDKISEEREEAIRQELRRVGGNRAEMRRYCLSRGYSNYNFLTDSEQDELYIRLKFKD